MFSNDGKEIKVLAERWELKQKIDLLWNLSGKLQKSRRYHKAFVDVAMAVLSTKRKRGRKKKRK